MQKYRKMVIGNIVSNLEIEKEPNFNHLRFDSLVGIDDSVPTIFLGYKETKAMFGKINPLEKEISEDKYWTFARNENNKIMNQDLFAFKIKCHKKFVDNYRYVFVSPMNSTNYIKNVIRKVQENISTAIVLVGKKDMLYIYVEDNIIGINLEMLRSVGINLDKLYKRFRAESKQFIGYQQLSDEIKYFGDILDSDMYCGLLL